ncbi:MAG: sulfur carrier protein ThiS [Candidatus Omnitrophica bacterium]|nr:sulfur carrier protein ThiS [Candidatus Omnitrophota bacterium]
MKIKVNGTYETVNDAVTLLEIITKKGLSPDRVIIEYNKIIVSKEELPKISPKENDSIEIVAFVGGG